MNRRKLLALFGIGCLTFLLQPCSAQGQSPCRSHSRNNGNGGPPVLVYPFNPSHEPFIPQQPVLPQQSQVPRERFIEKVTPQSTIRMNPFKEIFAEADRSGLRVEVDRAAKPTIAQSQSGFDLSGLQQLTSRLTPKPSTAGRIANNDLDKPDVGTDKASSEGLRTETFSTQPNIPANVRGSWVGVSENSEGRPTRFVLRLDANGQAELVIDGNSDEVQRVRTKFRTDDGLLVLIDDRSVETVLGRITHPDANRMTLIQSGGQTTLFRE